MTTHPSSARRGAALMPAQRHGRWASIDPVPRPPAEITSLFTSYHLVTCMYIIYKHVHATQPVRVTCTSEINCINHIY